MGVLELVGVFESEGENPVEGRVGEEYDPDELEYLLLRKAPVIELVYIDNKTGNEK